GLQVPDLDRVPLTAHGQPPAIRAEGHVDTRPGDPRAKDEASFFLLVQAALVQPLRIPEFYGPVAARRSQLLAVLAKHQSADIPFLFIERADRLAGLSLPYVHGATALSRNQVAAVGAERHGTVWQGEILLSGREFEDFPLGPRVPDSNGIDTNRGNAMAFGVPGQTEADSAASHDRHVALERRGHLSFLCVPDLHDPAVASRSNPLPVGAERHAPDFIAVLVES